MFYFFRVLVVVFVSVLAFFLPNINLIMILSGAILGTTVNIVIPVLFYNRAYSLKPKNRTLETSLEQNEQDTDSRACVKASSWILLTLGIVIGLFGLIYVIFSIVSGNAKPDEI